MRAIESNLAEVRANMARAAERSGRDPSDVKLVCVTKTVGPIEIETLYQLGERRMGENRVQEARAKRPAVVSLDIEWHLIGHLQTNKVKAALELFSVFHSVDSLRLAEEISRRAESRKSRIPILLEVNISGEESKYGIPVEVTSSPAAALELFELVRRIAALPGLEVLGLMTMAPLVEDPETVRPVFRQLRELRDEINSRRLAPHPLRELSMGMTNDYRVAIEEGATFVRIGTALFRD